jgi:hypothetical protein
MADQDPNKILQETAETISALKDAFNSLGAVIKNQLNKNLIDADDYTKQYIKSIRGDAVSALSDLGKKSEKIVENQFKLQRGQITSKDISKQIEALELRRLTTQGKIVSAVRSGFISAEEGRKTYLKVAEAILEGKYALESQNEEAKEIESRLGTLPAVFKSISKIPVLGGLVNSSKAVEAMQQAAAGGASTMEILGSGLSNSVSKAQLAEAALLALGMAGLKADEQTTNLAKSLTQSKYEAAQTRDNLAGMARESSDNFITTEKLVESTVKLGKQLGLAQTFSADLTKEFTTLTGKIGLSEEAAGGLAKLTIASGKNARTITNEALGTAQALQSQAGLQLDNKQILEETGKVSGQLLANFKGNPVAIAAAVTQVKLLGTTLEQTKAQSSALLDFRSSIEDQLSAQLITGEQLNLENARALALAGDQAGVAKELSNQGMNFSKFSRLNVLAQNDYAKALGLTSNELSDQLLKQQYYGKSVKEVAALEGEQVAQRLEAQSAQDKFNQAVEKLQDIFVSLIDGPIGQLLDLLADILGFIGKIGQLIAKVIPAPLLKVLMGAGAGFLVGGPAGALVGGGLAAGSEIFNATNKDDMMSDYGSRTLITPQGSYALNNSDTVIAGTNLFRGNDVYSGPKGAINLGGGEIDYDRLAASMSKVQMVTYARPSEFATPIGGKIIRDQRTSM